MDNPTHIHTPLRPVQLRDQGAASVVGEGEEATEFQIHGLSAYGRRCEGGAFSSSEMELPSGSLAAGGPGREQATVQQHASPPQLSREADGLLLDAALAGLDVVAEGLSVVDARRPYKCVVCLQIFRRETSLHGHLRSSHGYGRSSSYELAPTPTPTPKRARKKPASKLLPSVKEEPCNDKRPFLVPGGWGTKLQRRCNAPHAAGEEAPPERMPNQDIEIRHDVMGIPVRVGGQPRVIEVSGSAGRLGLVSTVAAGRMLGVHNDSNVVRQAVVPPLENPEVNASKSNDTVCRKDIIYIDLEDDSSDDENAPINIDDDDTDPVIALAGSGGVSAGSASSAAVVLAMEPAATAVAVTLAPGPRTAASVTIFEELASVTIERTPAVAGTVAGIIPPVPAPVEAAATATAPPATSIGVATPIPPHTVERNGFREGACYRHGGYYGKAIAGHSNDGHGNVANGNSNVVYGKGASGYSSGGYGKAITIGGESKKGLGKVYTCQRCGQTFDVPQALGGHVRSHSRWEKKGKSKFPYTRDAILALPASRAVHQPPQGMAMAGNPVAGHFPAAIATTGWPLPIDTSSVLPAIPLQTQDMAMAGNPVAGHFPAAIATTGWPLPADTSSVLPASPLQTQDMAMAGNPVARHFPAIATTGWPLPADTSSVHPAIPLQTQEGSPPEEITVAPGNLGPAFPLHNQEEIVSANSGGHTVLLFGVNIADGPKEPKK
ncbi:hypothetical protein BS78_K272800 [Paspalum vaginatum]|uniref:C2H2-type domain-containing protein n=1 Tax=Paspalum vaginatum TaxID=158149 RepID=A0A9W7X9X6_9POAL|nr:hypothetical protein BS78_K272800 [Paspalum vaginatum]